MKKRFFVEREVEFSQLDGLWEGRVPPLLALEGK